MFGPACSITAGENGDELDTTGAELPEDVAVAQDIFAACSIRTGALPWAPGDTLDVNEQLGRAVDNKSANALARAIQAILLRDERYQAADVTVSMTGNVLSIRVVGSTDTGTFELELQQDGATFRVVKVA